MIWFEIKKVLSRKSGKLALALLGAIVLFISYWAVYEVEWVNEQGVTEHGIGAIQKLREAKKEWEGELTLERLRQALQENARINETPEAQSADVTENNIAYSWRQGISDIRSLMVRSFCDFSDYDYYRADTLTAGDMENFYTNRVLSLKEWLEREDVADQFSQAEREYLVERYEALETPIRYDYSEGWQQLFQYSPAVLMLIALFLGFLTAGIFSGEFSWKSDAVLFSSRYGRDRAVRAKVLAGFLLVTAVYWAAFLIYSGMVLAFLGTDGAGCPIQSYMGGWKSFYNITFFQEYLLIGLGGYVGNLFLLFLTMQVSAKTGSTVLAVLVPFALIFLPSFLSEFQVLSGVLGLLPDQLLQMNLVTRYFNLYQLGSRVLGAARILPVLYGVLTLLLPPVLYQVYRKKEIL